MIKEISKSILIKKYKTMENLNKKIEGLGGGKKLIFNKVLSN